jgi:hypothetical protein
MPARYAPHGQSPRRPEGEQLIARVMCVDDVVASASQHRTQMPDLRSVTHGNEALPAAEDVDGSHASLSGVLVERPALTAWGNREGDVDRVSALAQADDGAQHGIRRSGPLPVRGEVQNLHRLAERSSSHSLAYFMNT